LYYIAQGQVISLLPKEAAYYNINTSL